MSEKVIVDYSYNEFANLCGYSESIIRKDFSKFLKYYQLDEKHFKVGSQKTAETAFQCETVKLVALMFILFKSTWNDQRNAISLDKITDFNCDILEEINELPEYLRDNIKANSGYSSINAIMKLFPILIERLVLLFSTMINFNNNSAGEVLGGIVDQIDCWIDNYFVHNTDYENFRKQYPEGLVVNYHNDKYTNSNTAKYTFNSIFKETLLRYLRTSPCELPSDIPSELLESMNQFKEKYDLNKPNTSDECKEKIDDIREKYIKFSESNNISKYNKEKIKKEDLDLEKLIHSKKERYSANYLTDRNNEYKESLKQELNKFLYGNYAPREMVFGGRNLQQYVSTIKNSNCDKNVFRRCVNELCDIKAKEHREQIEFFKQTDSIVYDSEIIENNLKSALGKIIFNFMKTELNSN